HCMGGIVVAAGDLIGLGMASIVTGVDFNGPPLVRAFAFDPTQPNRFVQTHEFAAYDAGFKGGVRVAVGDVQVQKDAAGNILLDAQGNPIIAQAPIIVTAPGPGAVLPVRVFTPNATSATLTHSFFPYSNNFSQGIYVAVANLHQPKNPNDIVPNAILTGPGAGDPLLRIFSGPSYMMASMSFYAFRNGSGKVLATDAAVF